MAYYGIGMPEAVMLTELRRDVQADAYRAPTGRLRTSRGSGDRRVDGGASRRIMTPPTFSSSCSPPPQTASPA